MTDESFHGGIKVVESALQGECAPPFLALVQEKFQTVEEDVWSEMVELLCRSPKRARDLVLNDFLRAMTDAYAHRRAGEKRIEHAQADRLRNGSVMPFHEIVAKVVEAHPSRYLRELNANLQAHVKGRNAANGWSVVPPSPPAPPLPDPVPEEQPRVEESGKPNEEDWKL